MAKEYNEIEPIHVALMWNLIFTGDEPKKSEMKPDIKPAGRRDLLVRMGLKLYEKRGRSTHAVVTDAGWRWAGENLDRDFGRATVNPALAGLLKKLKGYMERESVALAELLAAPPGARTSAEAGTGIPAG